MRAEKLPLVVRDLGIGGVNVVATPLSMGENELAQAQNAEPYLERGIAGVRKRQAYRPVNTIALDPTQGLMSIELAQGGAGNNLASDGSNGIAISGAPGLILVVRNGGGGGGIGESDVLWSYTIDGGITWPETDIPLTKDIANSSGPMSFIFLIRATDASAATGDQVFTLLVDLEP